MKSNRWTLTGVSTVVAGVLMLGAAYATSGVVSAGGNQTPCGATATPDPEVISRDRAELVAAMLGQQECTETPRIVRTHTPLPSATATTTSVPATIAPTNTPKPSSGTDAASVKPPNTGSGGSVGSDLSVWLLVLGATSLAAGGGAVLAGVRRR